MNLSPGLMCYRRRTGGGEASIAYILVYRKWALRRELLSILVGLVIAARFDLQLIDHSSAGSKMV